MNILITGAGGFLGKHLIKELSKEKRNQILAATSQYDILQNEWSGNENINILSNDMVFTRPEFLHNIDVFINCAFPRNTDGVQMAKGLEYIQKILELSVELEVKSIINISSQSVYSQVRKNAADEHTEINLESKYAIGKYAVELMTNSICKNIPHTNLRMASLIGPQFNQRVTNKMVDLALENGSLFVKKNQQLFGFLDVEDAVQGILLLLRIQPDEWDNVYNLGSEHVYTLIEIAEVIKAILEMDYGKIIEIHAETDDKVLNSAMDSSLFYKKVGFSQNYTLEESIRRIINEKIVT